MNSFIGIDTSNYTTSLAMAAEGKKINLKKLLTVKENERGVRQSEAVFMHTVNLPEMMEQLTALKCEGKIAAVGVSKRPRRVEGSYMPCFLAGVSAAASMACALGVPLYDFSHQEGHIRAAIEGVVSCGRSFAYDDFYSFHLSGGTCEFLRVKRDDYGYSCTPVITTADITPGQLIDRCGVMMGLRFPCGAALDRLAVNSGKRYKIQIKNNGKLNLSGFENKACDMIKKGETKEDVAAFVFCAVLEAVKTMLAARSEDLPVLFAGGVSSSSFLQSAAGEWCDAFFASSEYSTDNALGIALLTKESYERWGGPWTAERYTPSGR